MKHVKIFTAETNSINHECGYIRASSQLSI